MKCTICGSFERKHNCIVELQKYITALEVLLDERTKVLREIPPCELHGQYCISHAVEWVKRKKTK